MRLAHRVRALSLAALACLPLLQCNSQTSAPGKPSRSAQHSVVRYEGIDVSHYQGEVDWQDVRAAGIHFAFAKATEGDAEVDPRFSENWAAMREAGIVRGAYHFFTPEKDAASQAKHFIDTVQLESGDLPPALDIEIAQDQTEYEIDEGVTVWLQTVAKAFGVRPILYSDHSFIEQDLGGRFSRYPLWYAEYSTSTPALPSGDWEKWTFWQYTQNGTVAGIEGNVDRDRFEGSREEWEKLLVP